MAAYSVIMFLVAVLFVGLSIAIYKGNTDLIHDYHQTRVTDKAGYGRAFGKALSVIAITLLLSGIIGLVGHSDEIAMLAIVVAFIGTGIGVGCIVAVQRKYNKGIF